MWRAIGSSVVGSSHEKLQLPCQDACEYYSCVLGAERVLLIAIADGAGSAKASEVGSRAAVDHILQKIAGSGLNLMEITQEVISKWMLSVRDCLEGVAQNEQL